MEFYDFIKNKPPAVGTDEVLMPGEPEIHSRQARTTQGIPVDDETISQLLDIGESYSLKKDSLLALLQIQR